MKHISFNHIVSALIAKLKGENFQIDTKIPFLYIIQLIIERVIQKVRGILFLFPKGRKVFLGKRVKLKSKSLIFINGVASISDYCYIDGLSLNGIYLGNNFSLGRFASIECTGSIKNIGIGFSAGKNVGIGSFSHMGSAGGIKIGDDSIIGGYVTFHAENHEISDSDILIRNQSVTRFGIEIGENCWIGSKVTILDNVYIGSHSVVAAGAVVTAGRYPSYSILAGVPAKVIRRRK